MEELERITVVAPLNWGLGKRIEQIKQILGLFGKPLFITDWIQKIVKSTAVHILVGMRFLHHSPPFFLKTGFSFLVFTFP